MADTKSLSERRRAYWQDNLRIMAWLMVVWFFVSYGCGILLVEPLNKIQLGGYKLGFPAALQLVKTTGKEEGGAAYSRSNAVLLPARQNGLQH